MRLGSDAPDPGEASSAAANARKSVTRLSADLRSTWVLLAGFLAGGLSTVIMSVAVGRAHSPLVWLGVPTLIGTSVALAMMMWCSRPQAVAVRTTVGAAAFGPPGIDAPNAVYGREGETIRGYEDDELVGALHGTVVPPEDAAAVRAGLEGQLNQAHRLESVGQLAGGIAHDFNNLLAGIMNYTALVATGLVDLSERLGPETDEDIATLRDDVDQITSVAKRGAQLTHQLLIFSHREVATPEVLDLNSVVVDMEKLLRRTIGEAVDLRTKLDPSLPNTVADRGQIEQVVMNLAVNARDAMRGSGCLRIATSRFDADTATDLVHSLRPGAYVRLTVSDDGLGMPPEVASRAFEPFFTTKPRGEGTGLGLATVHGIVTKARGEVMIMSQPGGGTAVIVDLPVSDRDAPPARCVPHQQSLGARGETILLVEDEDIVREPTRRILVRSGYTVLAASNAAEALRIAREQPEEIHLLLTDVIMPGRSGPELAADLSDPQTGIRVLYMSGYSHDMIAHEGVLEDGISLIEKPFATDDLLRKVRGVLDDN